MPTIAVIISLTLCLNFPSIAGAQELNAADRKNLNRAEKVADIFVESFRRTLDFGAVWKNFRAEQFNCRLVKSDLITSISDEEKVKLGTALLERAYVALMNYYYLRGAYDLSVARLGDKTEDQVTPKEILKTENSSVYIRTNGKTPTTAKEIQEYIIELNRLARLYRKYMPRNAMKSGAWRANHKYLTSRSGITHLGVDSGHSDFCIPEHVKYYIVGRGLFYFYMTEEKGEMKIIELAVL